MSGNKEALGSILIWTERIFVVVKSGMVVWNWIEPESFFDAIKFILTWVVIFYKADIITGVLIV